MKRKLLPIAIAAASFSVAGVSNAEINMNGFATISGGAVLTEDKSINGLDEDINFQTESNIGLQFSSEMGDGINATAQFIARGDNNWGVEAEWAYISYDVTDSVKVLAGKQRSPFYMYSDYKDVGYAYHWAAVPDNVYWIGFDSSNGVSVIMNNYFGDLDSTFQIMYSTIDKPDSSLGPLDLSMLQLNWTAVYDFATFRVGYTNAKLNIENEGLDTLAASWVDAGAGAGFDGQKIADNILIKDDTATFIGAGLTLDFDSYFFVAEISQLNLETSLLGINTNSYIGAGYRVGDFTVHATYMLSNETATESDVLYEDIPDAVLPALGALTGPTEATFEGQRAEYHAISAGVRWDFNPSAALKFDLTNQVDDKDNADPEYEPNRLFYRLAMTTVF
ncbi:MAG: hypothetical protein HRU38_04045 [Saccharospirillaceae bacterium]|nr:porin [Pseudomonadales bacterium]NRB77836.1 hypothetical protein [Saccharospirillaceae bacterium]